MIEWPFTWGFVTFIVPPIGGAIIAAGKWAYNTHANVQEHARLLTNVQAELPKLQAHVDKRADKLESKLDDLTDFLLREMPRK